VPTATIFIATTIFAATTSVTNASFVARYAAASIAATVITVTTST
jgi:hypothetical protein